MSQYFRFLLFTYIYFLGISSRDKNDSLVANLVKDETKIIIEHSANTHSPVPSMCRKQAIVVMLWLRAS